MNFSRRFKKSPVPLPLEWSHAGVQYRLTPWPEARCERLYQAGWIPFTPSAEAQAAATQRYRPADWQAYLELAPEEVRDLLAHFGGHRVAALTVAARCPALVPVLLATPALTAFVAAHAELRGIATPRWAEIEAVYERGNVFGLLEWLGLPSSRQTLAILQRFASPEVPPRFLAPLRTLLWEPQAIFALQRLTAITEHHLAHHCHALAA
ncbi:MAG: hypothetical protein HZA31_11595 [Opitutae bacterium]|nr:hypothetical protein [Opitutae bacterium]